MNLIDRHPNTATALAVASPFLLLAALFLFALPLAWGLVEMLRFSTWLLGASNGH